LLNDANSIFSIDDFLQRRDTTFHLNASEKERVLHRLLELIPDITASFGATHYRRFHDLLMQQTASPRVLVVGGSILGRGMESLINDSRIEFVATDVSMGPLTALICDAHDLPFDDEMFDGAVVQAVLEHVIDPYRCVSEIHRILKSDGLVYAETPFMQQVHMGAYDFTRFTHSGHRRLFRAFAEIASGPVCGPGMALAWAYQYFLLSFAESKLLRGFLRVAGQLTAFFLKYFDYYLIRRRAAVDAAAGFFFIGRKAGSVLSDRELINYYRGAMLR
jgi:SAM-dependent methyltransferase